MNDFLPIGSVVETINNRIYMIIGYLPNKPTSEKVYDYICCKNKIGLFRSKDKLALNSDYFYLNNSDIKNIIFIGYNDSKSDLVCSYMKEIKGIILDAKRKNTNMTYKEIGSIYIDFFKKMLEENSINEI